MRPSSYPPKACIITSESLSSAMRPTTRYSMPPMFTKSPSGSSPSNSFDAALESITHTRFTLSMSSTLSARPRDIKPSSCF